MCHLKFSQRNLQMFFFLTVKTHKKIDHVICYFDFAFDCESYALFITHKTQNTIIKKSHIQTVMQAPSDTHTLTHKKFVEIVL